MVLGLPLEKIDLRDVCYWACSYPVQYWLEAWVVLRTTCSTAELCSCMQVLKARWAAWWDRMWAQGTECCLVLVLLQYYHLLTKNLFTEVWELKRGLHWFLVLKGTRRWFFAIFGISCLELLPRKCVCFWEGIIWRVLQNRQDFCLLSSFTMGQFQAFLENNSSCNPISNISEFI